MAERQDDIKTLVGVFELTLICRELGEEGGRRQVAEAGGGG